MCYVCQTKATIGQKLQRGSKHLVVALHTVQERRNHPLLTNFVEVQELASHCNVLIICCSLREETRHIINRDVLTALAEHGIIIVCRRAIVHEKELVECLVRGEIGGAGLVVFDNEPNVPEELFALDNVVITPHRSAFTAEAIFNSFQILIANLEASSSDRPLLSG
ncbi:hypothetical protein ACH5RR_000273 [Cinchona calisaya]|uniref:D-isomer specific 2-hydroxyacid dehydrogenase NAD-binding domain-containing protein n=1 Tax=Cinchona calisaya TaxID=153742 RepID=A0ABD3B161_9GENT